MAVGRDETAECPLSHAVMRAVRLVAANNLRLWPEPGLQDAAGAVSRLVGMSWTQPCNWLLRLARVWHHLWTRVILHTPPLLAGEMSRKRLKQQDNGDVSHSTESEDEFVLRRGSPGDHAPPQGSARCRIVPALKCELSGLHVQ